MALRELQRSDDRGGPSEEATPLVPDLPPLVLQEGENLPADPEAITAEQQDREGKPLPTEQGLIAEPPQDSSLGSGGDGLPVAPPPPLLPPPPAAP